MALSSLTDLLASGGKSAKFDNIGDSVIGTVVKAEVRQKTDPDTGKLQYWDDGAAIEQIAITLATELRDPADREDNGQRTVYIKGWGDQLRALKAALAAAGATEILPGGRFAAHLTGRGEKAKAHHSPPNIFSYEYAAPAVAAVSNLLAAVPVQAAVPATAPVAPAAVPAMTPEQVAAFNAYMAQQAQAAAAPVDKPPF